MSSIEWTDKTWNPVTGCKKISPGCAHCYAADIAKRFWGDRPFSDVQFHPERLQEPLKRKAPTMWFVNSMSDLFFDSITDEQLDQVFAVMALTPQHTYQVLTKRPERMLEYLKDCDRFDNRAHAIEHQAFLLTGDYPLIDLPLTNVWLGVSVEDQRRANERIPLLSQIPAAVRFLSCEPLLEDVTLPMESLDWVIVGGESGPKARPFNIDWARSLIHQCQQESVPVFLKQLGSRPFWVNPETGQTERYPSKGKGGNPEEWPADLQNCREFPTEVKAA